MDPPTDQIPVLRELTIENITENVIRINSQTTDLRLKYILERLVTHVHDFARETRLSTQEWMAGINFLTQVGQISSAVRQEFILLSDVLGLSLLVDSIDHPKPAGSTDGTVLGPFHTHEAPAVEAGGSISGDPDGEPCLAVCSVKDVEGNPVGGARVDIWETDSKGFYDVQYGEREGADGRCVITSDEEGGFWFKAIVPVPYPIPHDGPVGKLLKALRRHPYRPSHMHFMFEKPGYDHLITYVLKYSQCSSPTIGDGLLTKGPDPYMSRVRHTRARTLCLASRNHSSLSWGLLIGNRQTSTVSKRGRSC